MKAHYRFLLLLLPALLLPSLSLIFFIHTKGEWEELESKATSLVKSREIALLHKKQLDPKNIEVFQKASLTRFKQLLEQHSFLSSEKSRWEEFEKRAPLLSFEEQTRAKFFKGGKNLFLLEEHPLEKSPLLAESQEKMLFPIQIDTEDLFYLLSLESGVLENTPLPHLIFSQLDFHRKNIKEGLEVFQLNKCELLKREYSCCNP